MDVDELRAALLSHAPDPRAVTTADLEALLRAAWSGADPRTAF